MKAKNAHLLAVTLMLITVGTALAEVSLKIRDLDVDDNVYTPHFMVDTELDHSQGPSDRWIRIEVEYETRGEWITELTIQHLADAGMNTTCPTPVILTEEVTYINIAPGNHKSFVYMHPHTVERYSQTAKNLDVAVRFLINGKVVAVERTNKESKGDWTVDPKRHLHEGYLLNESETPFWFINYDYKEIMKHTPHPGATNACRDNVVIAQADK